MKRNRCGGLRVAGGSESLISSSGASLLLRTAQVSGLTKGLSRGRRPWRADRWVHDPGKIVLDLAVAVALGGDCLADAAVVRAQPELFGPVASDPTVSRLIEALGGMTPAAVSRHPMCAAGRAGQGVAATAARSRRMHRSSSIWMPRWSARIRRRKAPPTFKRGFGFTPCSRSSTTAKAVPVSHWRSCCARAKPMPTTPTIRSGPPRGSCPTARSGAPSGAGAWRCRLRESRRSYGTSAISGWSSGWG